MKVRRTSLSHRQLIQKLIKYYKGDFVTLSSRGIAAILAFKSDAANLTYMIPEDTDDVDKAVDNVAKNISKEIREMQIDRENYHAHIDKDICSKFQSNTFQSFCQK